MRDLFQPRPFYKEGVKLLLKNITISPKKSRKFLRNLWKSLYLSSRKNSRLPKRQKRPLPNGLKKKSRQNWKS